MRTMLLAVLMIAVLAGNALADNCPNVGTQLHVVGLGSRPIGTGGMKLVVVGEYLKVPKTGGEIYFATIGIRQPLSCLWIMPQVSYLGGWFSGEDGLSVAGVAGANVGSFAATLDFKRLSAPGGHRAKLWYHTLDYKFGPEVGANREWTVGLHFQKVDVSERWGAHAGYQ